MSLRRLWIIASLLVACTGGEAAPAAPPPPAPPHPARSAPPDDDSEAVDDTPASPTASSTEPTEPAPAARPGECTSGDDCLRSGRLAHRAGHPREAASLFERGCEVGSAAACHALAEAYRDGDGVRADEGRADELFREACAAGSAAACDAMGH